MALYLAFVTFSLRDWCIWILRAYCLTAAAFAVIIPFILALIRYCMFPKQTLLSPVPSLRPVYVSIAGWLIISVISIIANVLMYASFPASMYWSWMAVVGVFTWPLMEVVFYLISKKECKKEQ